MKRISEEEIERKKSPKGGWTKAQLAEWGVKWPPPKGWKKRLTGKSTSSIKKSTSTNNPILPIDPPPNGWLRSLKKVGFTRKQTKELMLYLNLETSGKHRSILLTKD